MKKVIFGLALGLIISYSTIVFASQDNPLKIWYENRNGQMETWCVVDDNTGVNYIVVGARFGNSGYHYDGVTVTPRYNADGTLYITK